MTKAVLEELKNKGVLRVFEDVEEAKECARDLSRYIVGYHDFGQPASYGVPGTFYADEVCYDTENCVESTVITTDGVESVVVNNEETGTAYAVTPTVVDIDGVTTNMYIVVKLHEGADLYDWCEYAISDFCAQIREQPTVGDVEDVLRDFYEMYSVKVNDTTCNVSVLGTVITQKELQIMVDEVEAEEDINGAIEVATYAISQDFHSNFNDVEDIAAYYDDVDAQLIYSLKGVVVLDILKDIDYDTVYGNVQLVPVDIVDRVEELRERVNS